MMVSVVAEVAVGIGVTLGGGIKALGDGVQAGRVSNGKPSNSIATKVVGVSLGISRPLAVVVSVVAEMVSVETMGIGKVSLGGDIKALGDGVQARRVSEGNGGNNGSVGVSGPLAVVVGNRKSSLGHWVKPLGDGIQTGRRGLDLWLRPIRTRRRRYPRRPIQGRQGCQRLPAGSLQGQEGTTT